MACGPQPAGDRPPRSAAFSRVAKPRPPVERCRRRVGEVVMPLDVYHLQSFYDSPLGELSRRLVGRVIRARWQDAAGLSVAALGFGSPYLDRFRGTAARCIALMPAPQGVAHLAGIRTAAPALSWRRRCCLCRTLRSIACCSPTRWRRPNGPRPSSRNFGESPRRKGASSSWSRRDAASGLASTAPLTDKGFRTREASCATCFSARFSPRSSGEKRSTRRRSPGSWPFAPRRPSNGSARRSLSLSRECILSRRPSRSIGRFRARVVARKIIAPLQSGARADGQSGGRGRSASVINAFELAPRRTRVLQS